jgi:ABC-2 type transport system ATP-binding protein
VHDQVVLELNGLTRRYGELVALDGVSFTVAPGEVVGFVGRNGAGKTTAMRITLGLLVADAGIVRWQGAEPTLEVRRRHFGYMPEERGLYPKMRVAEQLRYLGELSGLTPAEARRATDSWLARLGIDERAGSPLEALSLGNQQRAQLAAAVVHDPDLLVLDEPFSGLDPVGVDILADALAAEVRRGAAVLFSSHQLDLVERICDRIVIIDRGCIVAAGTIAALRSQRSARARRRVQVDVAASDPDWVHRVPGVIAVECHDGHTTVELADGADDQALLDAARAAGTVRRFAVEQPSLAEVFRDVVAA